MRQLDELKPRIAKLAALNAKYKVCAMYHTFAGTSVGTSIWDLYSVLKDFDPALVGFHYDTGHMASEGAAGSWTTNLRMLGPYLRGVAVKDYAWNRAENGQWTRRGEAYLWAKVSCACRNSRRFSNRCSLRGRSKYKPNIQTEARIKDALSLLCRAIRF
jgi:sugar phosphate isomerase/epimerase